MGVRITAYSRVQVTEPHEAADACWDVEPYHLQAFVYDGFEQSARGLDLGRCWLAYHEDWSGMAVFATELDALRHANGTSMVVAPLTDGQTFGPGRPL